MRVKLLIPALVLMFAFSAIAAANGGEDWEPPIGPDYADNPPASEQQNLKDVRKYYNESSYAWAASAANYYVEHYPKGISRPEVEYILAKCMLQTQEYEGVLDKLEFIMKKYPRSSYAIDAADIYVDLFSEMNQPYYYWDWSTYLYEYLGVDDYYDYDNKKMLKARKNALKLAENTYKNHMKHLSSQAKMSAADRNVFNHMIMMPYFGLDDYDDETKTYKNYDKYLTSVEKKEMSREMKSVLAFYRGFVYASMYPIDGDEWPGTDEEDFYQWQTKKRFEVAEDHWHNVATEYPDILGGIVARAAIAHYKVVLYNNPEEAAVDFDELATLVKTDNYRVYLEGIAEDLRGPGLVITSVTSDPTGTPQVTVNMGAKGYDEVEMTLYPVNPRYYYKASSKLYEVDIYLTDGRVMRTDSELWYDYGEGEKVDEVEIDRIEPRPTSELPGVGEPVENWTVATRYADDLRISSFEATLEDVAPGMYIVEAQTEDGNMSRSLFLHSKVSAVTTYDNHDFFYQLSDSEDGEPVPITGVTAYNIVYEPDDRGYNREQYKDVKLITRKSGDGYLANMDKLKESTTVYLVLESEDGPALTSFYTPYSYSEDTTESGIVYTDKPMYLPEQTVNYKVILRKVDYVEKALSPVIPTTISLRLVSPDGSELWTGEAKTDDFGTLWGSVELPPGAMLGSYYMYADWSRGEGDEQRNYSASGYFSLEEYEKPEYEMFIEADKDRYLSGEDVRLNITGKYYFGAPMADSKVEYEITRSGYTDKDYEYGVVVKKGEAETDAEGQFVLEWPTKYAGEYDNSYNVWVKITDPSNHEIEEWYYVYTYRNDRFVSIATDKYDYHRDEAIEVDFTTYDWYSDYLSMPVDLTVYEYWYDNEDYEYKTGDVIYETSTVTDSEGLGEVIVELADPPAMVLLEARIEDTVGTEVLTSTSVNFIAEDIETTERVPEIEITVDEWYPELGDTINAKVRSRFEGVTAGVLFFSNDFQEYRNVELTADPDGGYSASFPITLEDRYLPQLQLKANLFHERNYYSHDTYVYITNTNTKMEVTVEVEKDEYTTSDENAKVTVKTATPYGNPITANLSLAAVDEALLALRYDQTEYLPNQFPNMLYRYTYPYITHSLYELGEMNTTNYKFLYYSGVSFYGAYDEVEEGSRAVELLYKYSLPYMVDDDIAIYVGYGSFDNLDPTWYDRVTGWSVGGDTTVTGSGGGRGLGAEPEVSGSSMHINGMRKMSEISVDEAAIDMNMTYTGRDVDNEEKARGEGFEGLLIADASPEEHLETTTIAGKTYAKAELREFFTDLAFWKPDLITDSNGTVSAEIELP
ncbi:MAG: hypothetical protein GY771_05110, partial [bacterium]|nr:hypothetical protein [bacterium]